MRDQVDEVIWQNQVQIDVPMPQVGEETFERPRIQERIVDVAVLDVMNESVVKGDHPKDHGLSPARPS